MKKIYGFWFTKFWLPTLFWLVGIVAIAVGCARVFRMEDSILATAIAMVLMAVVLFYKGQPAFVGNHFAWLTSLGFGRQKIMALALSINLTILLSFGAIGATALQLLPDDVAPPSISQTDVTKPKIKKMVSHTAAELRHDWRVLTVAVYLCSLMFVMFFLHLASIGKHLDGRQPSIVGDRTQHYLNRVRLSSYFVYFGLPAVALLAVFAAFNFDLSFTPEIALICMAVCLADICARKIPKGFTLSTMWQKRWATLSYGWFFAVTCLAMTLMFAMGSLSRDHNAEKTDAKPASVVER